MAGAYHDGNSAPDERRRIEEHRQSCSRCASFLNELGSLGNALLNWRMSDRVDWTAFERRVMTAVEKPRTSRWWAFPVIKWSALTAAASLAAVTTGFLLWHNQIPQTPSEPKILTAKGPSRTSSEFRKLSSEEDSDARTLYYRGLELMKNGRPDRAGQLFSDIRQRYPESGLAAASDYYQAYITDSAIDPAQLDEGTLRLRLAVWESIRLDALGSEEVEQALFYRAKIGFHLAERSRSPLEKQHALEHALAYQSRFPGRSPEVETWLARLR